MTDRPLSYLERIGGVVDEVDAQVVERRSGGTTDRREHGHLEQFDSVAAGTGRLSDQRVPHQTLGHDMAPSRLHLHEHRGVQRLFTDPRQQLKQHSLNQVGK